jgi:hypothetical protein
LISKALFWTLIYYCFVLVFVLVVDAGLVVAAFLMIIGLALIAPKLPTLGVGSSLGLGKFTLVKVALGSSFSLSAALVDLDGAATALFSTGLAGVAAFVVVGTFSSEIPLLNVYHLFLEMSQALALQMDVHFLFLCSWCCNYCRFGAGYCFFRHYSCTC